MGQWPHNPIRLSDLEPPYLSPFPPFLPPHIRMHKQKNQNQEHYRKIPHKMDSHSLCFSFESMKMFDDTFCHPPETDKLFLIEFTRCNNNYYIYILPNYLLTIYIIHTTTFNNESLPVVIVLCSGRFD